MNKTTTEQAGMVVEKVILDLDTGITTTMYAVCTKDPTPEAVAYSLLYEGYRTAWTLEYPT